MKTAILKPFIRFRKQLLGLLVLILFAMYFVLNQSDFSMLKQVEAGPLLIAGLCYVAIVITNGLFIKFVVQPFKIRLSVYESTRVSLVSSLGNFFAASGVGLGFRAIYLKRKHGLDYQDYMTTLYGNYLLIFIINSLAGLISLTMVVHKSSSQYKGVFVFFAGLLLVSTLLCFVSLPKPSSKSAGLIAKVHRILYMMTTGWRGIVKNLSLLFALSSLVTLQLAITVLLTSLEVGALGIHVSTQGLLLLSVLGALSVFVNITPANLGVKELVYIVTSSVVGLTTGQILSIAVIDRGVLFITLGLLWLLFGKTRFMSNTETDRAG